MAEWPLSAPLADERDQVIGIMGKRRVVITGMGMLSPLGNDVATSWQGILQGRSGISEIDRFDASEYNTRIGGAVRNLDIATFLSPKDAGNLMRLSSMA